MCATAFLRAAVAAILITAIPAVSQSGASLKEPQSAATQKSAPINKGGSAAQPAKLTPRQLKALQIVKSVQAQMGHFSQEVQVELLLEMADTYQRIDRTQQVPLLMQAFDASLSISNLNTRRNQEYEIIRRLSLVDPNAVLELRNVVDPESRGIVERAVLRQNIRLGKLDDAVKQLTQWDPAWHFPYSESVGLIYGVGSDKSVERQAIFSAAIAGFRHEDPRGFYGVDTLDRLILNCYNQVPPAMVTDAIDVYLDRAKSKGDAWQATVSREAGTLTFDSVYEFDVFQFLSVLQQVDPAKAKALLRENPNLAARLDQFNQSGQSARPDAPGAPLLIDRSSISVTSKGNEEARSVNLQLAEQRRITDALVSNAIKDPKGALTAAQSLSNERIGTEADLETPRCAALLAIAQSLQFGNKPVATEALRDLVAATRDVPTLIKANYLVHAAAISAQMDDTATAKQDLELGTKAAAELYQVDAFGDPSNSASKNHWPSTIVWKALVVASACFNSDEGLAMRDAIADPEIEAIVKIALAAAFTGKPPVDTEVTFQRGGSTWVTTFDIPWWQGFSTSDNGHNNTITVN